MPYLYDYEVHFNNHPYFVGSVTLKYSVFSKSIACLVITDYGSHPDYERKGIGSLWVDILLGYDVPLTFEVTPQSVMDELRKEKYQIRGYSE